jgi:hypothetical protein
MIKNYSKEGVFNEWLAAGLVTFDWNRGEHVYTDKGRAEIKPTAHHGLYAPDWQSEKEADRRCKELTEEPGAIGRLIQVAKKEGYREGFDEMKKRAKAHTHGWMLCYGPNVPEAEVYKIIEQIAEKIQEEEENPIN